MTKTVEEWLEVFTVLKPKERAGVVEAEARAALTDKPLPTREFTDKLWPEQFTKGQAITRRLEFVNLILKLAKGPLADCVVKDTGHGRLKFGKVFYPWMWRTPIAPAPANIVAPDVVVPAKAVRLVEALLAALEDIATCGQRIPDYMSRAVWQSERAQKALAAVRGTSQNK